MAVMINDRQSLYETSKVKELIESVVLTALQIERKNEKYEVSVTLVDDDMIREINREYRNKDVPTDVLSFPLLENGEAGTEIDKDLDTGEIVLGDIVISLERADEQSKEYGHSFEREVAFLTVHGMLHLLGYDHEREDERQEMRAREENILDALNIKR